MNEAQKGKETKINSGFTQPAPDHVRFLIARPCFLCQTSQSEKENPEFPSFQI